MPEITSTSDFLTTAEAAKFLAVKPATIIKYCNSGQIKSCFFARHWRFQRSDLLAFAAAHVRSSR